MTISVGAKLPDASLQVMGGNGPETVSLAEKLSGRNVVIFGLPEIAPDPLATVVEIDVEGQPKQKLGAGCVLIDEDPWGG